MGYRALTKSIVKFANLVREANERLGNAQLQIVRWEEKKSWAKLIATAATKHSSMRLTVPFKINHRTKAALPCPSNIEPGTSYPLPYHKEIWRIYDVYEWFLDELRYNPDARINADIWYSVEEPSRAGKSSKITVDIGGPCSAVIVTDRAHLQFGDHLVPVGRVPVSSSAYTRFIHTNYGHALRPYGTKELPYLRVKHCKYIENREFGHVSIPHSLPRAKLVGLYSTDNHVAFLPDSKGFVPIIQSGDIYIAVDGSCMRVVTGSKDCFVTVRSWWYLTLNDIDLINALLQKHNLSEFVFNEKEYRKYGEFPMGTPECVA